MIAVDWLQGYLPAVNKEIPAFGVLFQEGTLRIQVADTVPADALCSLPSHVKDYLVGVEDLLSEEAVTYLGYKIVDSFFRSLVAQGELRYSEYEKSWRWFGEPCR